MNEQNAPSENGKTNLRYYVLDGLFDLWTESHVNLYCDMDLTMYPFDTQKCDFVMQSNSKNQTYQGGTRYIYSISTYLSEIQH